MMFKQRACRLLPLLWVAALADQAGDSSPMVASLPASLKQVSQPSGPAAKLTVAAPAKLESDSTQLPMTTTPTPASVPAILESIAGAIYSELRNTPYQCFNALLALIFGSVLCFDGEFSFKWLTVAAVYMVVSIMAMSQVSSVWGLSNTDPLRHVIGLEAGLVGGYAALRGIDGVQIVVGAFLGVVAASKILAWLTAHGFHFLNQKYCMFVYFSFFVVGAALLMGKKRHVKLLALVSAFLGGAFCASSIAFGFTKLAVMGYMPFLQNLFPGITPVGGTWIQFMHLLWSSKAGDVGIFAGSRLNPTGKILGESWDTDRIADCALWFVFFVSGSIVQLRRPKKVSASAPVEMNQPLLSTELPN
eukprot:TRINITY_DN4418_c0_g1_i1.p1 TRINITY_DN4418_c0_g1~~TRINITY_DN4418_c0_g1_i1.p1  ORF type:complete len:361 (-),score=54.90 TRINITY_DN4418_c0_g1_i1:202-1284(-)